MSPSKFIYECIDCGKEYNTSDVLYLCPFCSKKNTSTDPPHGVLKILYDYQKIKNDKTGFDDLKKSDFIDLLPIENINSLPFLRIGKTPHYLMNKLNGKRLPFNIHLKDDSQNPTYSFKDRASALVSAFARENKLNVIVTASTGNAGSSLAGICAAQGQKAVIIVPDTAPVAKLCR
jgi:threonine synthase